MPVQLEFSFCSNFDVFSGSIITVTVELTTHHKGFFEFRLCPWNDVYSPITQECLDKYVLELNMRYNFHDSFMTYR